MGPHSSLAQHPMSLSPCPCLPTLPSASGVERTLVLPGSQTAFDLDDVRAGLSYTVRVSARVGLREGAASILTVRRELEAPLAIAGLRVVASDATRVRVAWEPVPGASGFRISWRTGSGQCGACGRAAEGTFQGMGDWGTCRSRANTSC